MNMKKTTIVIGVVSALFSSLSFAAAGAACPSTPTVLTDVEASVGAEACVCGGSTAGKTNYNGGSGAVVASPIFVKSGFVVQCSSNTYVSTNEVSSTAFAVAAGSAKGNQTVIGTSNGGAVTTSAQCAATGCTAANVTTANNAAKAIAAGS